MIEVFLSVTTSANRDNRDSSVATFQKLSFNENAKAFVVMKNWTKAILRAIVTIEA